MTAYESSDEFWWDARHQVKPDGGLWDHGPEWDDFLHMWFGCPL